jgi:hypothetical protein
LAALGLAEIGIPLWLSAAAGTIGVPRRYPGDGSRSG